MEKNMSDGSVAIREHKTGICDGLVVITNIRFNTKRAYVNVIV